MTDSFYSSIMI